jgi:hypothetical protein
MSVKPSPGVSTVSVAVAIDCACAILVAERRVTARPYAANYARQLFFSTSFCSAEIMSTSRRQAVSTITFMRSIFGSLGSVEGRSF